MPLRQEILCFLLNLRSGHYGRLAFVASCTDELTLILDLSLHWTLPRKTLLLCQEGAKPTICNENVQDELVQLQFHKISFRFDYFPNIIIYIIFLVTTLQVDQTDAAAV